MRRGGIKGRERGDKGEREGSVQGSCTGRPLRKCPRATCIHVFNMYMYICIKSALGYSWLMLAAFSIALCYITSYQPPSLQKVS